ncbi:hypothetical protein L7F22_027177 [Adiantum nelumboides]|nr:hypothetical protein [Adiantum nelumboides]
MGTGLANCFALSFVPRAPAKTPDASIYCCSSRSQFLQVKNVSYRPPGTEVNLLDHVSFELPEKSLGLIFGRSGSGKTTLLQVLAGLAVPTEGFITVEKHMEDEASTSKNTGIVFQFPERLESYSPYGGCRFCVD